MKYVNDKKVTSYRSSINRCMYTMLLFFALFLILFSMQQMISRAFDPLFTDVGSEVFYSLTYGVAYLLAFMLPVILFKSIYRNQTYYPIAAAPVLPKGTVRICFAAIAIVFPAAILNSEIMSVIYSIIGVTPDMSVYESEINGAHSFVLLFIQYAIIPALCEEFLFRGVILKNLLPYGKTVAVVASAVMFALMHQNLAQFFYTFIAGLVLGYVFLLSDSIWCGVLIHCFNNLLSVLASDVMSHYMNNVAAIRMQYLIYAVVELVGIICLISLIRSYKKDGGKPLKKGSVYGRTEIIAIPESDLKMDDKGAIKHFFTPVTICVISYAVLMAVYEMIFLILMSV